MASLHQGGEWIVEIDIEQFFDTASHERLLAAVAEVSSIGVETERAVGYPLGG